MKNKLLKILKEYKLTVIVALIVIVIGSIGLILFLNIFNNSSIKHFENNNYSINYDNSWKIKTKKENTITLKHGANSTINIEIIPLEENYKYASITDMLDKLLNDIKKQNPNYKLLSKEEDLITKNKYPGYKMLYEFGKSEVMVVATKESDKLILFTYESPNTYFDILLDSAQNIIYEFKTIKEKYDLTTKINLKTSEIPYKEETKVKINNETTNYEIASDNYYANYKLPSAFKLNEFNTKYNSFSYDKNLLKDGEIHLSAMILNRNIYEYLDKNSNFNIYSDFEIYKTDKDYSRFKENISKLNNKDYTSYIYKNSYYYDKDFTYDKDFKRKYKSTIRENIVLVFALNKDHILTIKIESTQVTIPKKLIDMIEINDSKNYASYIKVNKNKGNLITTLKRFTDYKKEKIEEITLTIPEKYEEIDRGFDNFYKRKNFSLNYDEKKEIYQYDVKYETRTNDIDFIIKQENDLFSKAYGEYNYLKYNGEEIYNDKKFQSYSGGYTDLGGIMFTSIDRFRYYVNTKVLLYKLENKGYLVITVKGKGNEISSEMLNELTNFEIKTKSVKEEKR